MTADGALRIGVLGAGAVGTTLALKLSAVGLPVTLVGRGEFPVGPSDLFVRDLSGRVHASGGGFELSTNPEALAGADICLVAVKSKDSESAGAALAPALRPGALVVSFQNGLRNAARLRRTLTRQTVLPGVVSANIVRPSDREFRQATSGPLAVGAADGVDGERLEALREAFARAGETLAVRDDIADVQAGKLLLNLNNGVCAVTGTTIAQSVRSRELRWCLAVLMREGLKVLGEAGFSPRSISGPSPRLIARVLPLPDAIVLRAAKSMVEIDPAARSSTLQDLRAGRMTEIGDICGEIVRLGEEVGRAAPANRLITGLVRELERQGPGRRFHSAGELVRRLRDVAA